MEDNETILFSKGKPGNEDIQRVEESFITLCKNFNIKWNTEKYFNFQSFYFSGAIMMCNYSVPSWSVAMMGRRPIVSKF